jgi:5'-nucleotidase
VYVALNSQQRILPRAPDVVISGINLGLNLGQDVFYSGTVAAAREGALRGLRALAVSAHTAAPHKPIGQLAGKIALAMMHRPKVAALTLLNLNVPAQWNGSVRVTRLGERLYDQGIDFRTDPRGREYLWIGGPGGVRHDPAPGTDTDAYDEGVASLTPLVLDLSAHAGETLAQNLLDSLEL